MKKNSKLDDKIRSSFESLNKKAPDMLWNQLSDSLPTDPLATTEPQPRNKRLYDKIRDSFSTFRHQSPQHAWKGINRQLNIDLVWSRLSRELDKAPSANWPLTRWAAVLLLFVFSFASGYYWYNQRVDPEYAGVVENSSALPTTTTTTTTNTAPDNERYVAADQAGDTNTTTKNRSNNNKTNNSSSNNTKSTKSRNSNTSSSGAISGLAGKPAISDTPAPEETSKTGGQESNVAGSLPSGADRQGNFNKNTDPLKEGIDQASASPDYFSYRKEGNSRNSSAGDRPTASKAGSSIPYGIMRLPMHNTVVEGRNFSIQPLIVDSIVLEPTAVEMLAEENEEKEIQPNKLSFGPVLAYNSSWLLNNETRSSFDKGSLISSSPTYKQNFGLALHYTFNHSSTLATEFHFISKAGQEYNTFNDGYYLKKGLELSYYKVYLQYQRNFFPHGERLLSNLTVKAGVYGGLLHRKNGEIRNTESKYSNSDYGLRFAFGQEKRLNRLVIAYGISGERGLTNIFMGSDKMPARFNKTYTLNFGPYLNFRYH